MIDVNFAIIVNSDGTWASAGWSGGDWEDWQWTARKSAPVPEDGLRRMLTARARVLSPGDKLGRPPVEKIVLHAGISAIVRTVVVVDDKGHWYAFGCSNGNTGEAKTVAIARLGENHPEGNDLKAVEVRIILERPTVEQITATRPLTELEIDQ